MRVAVGYLLQETNSFSPVATEYDDFGLLTGSELIARWRGSGTELGAFLGFLEQAGVEAVPLFAGWAITAGPVRAEAFQRLRETASSALLAAGPIDGLLLALHGAMAAEDEDDVEGRLLADFRRARPGLPIAVSLDLHANVTTRMAGAADIIVGYRTYPHIDMHETGLRTARLLLRVLRGEIRPVTAVRKLPLIVPAETSQTSHGPMRAVWDVAEGQPGALAVSVFTAQPWLDVAEMGCATVALADGDPALAERAANAAAESLWGLRAEFEPVLLTPEQAVEAALAARGGPVILAEPSDSPTAGSPGDSAELLPLLLTRAAGAPSALWICDPGAAHAARSAGAGASMDTSVGGAFDSKHRRRIAIRARVASLSDGRFTLRGQWNHGMLVDMGPSAVLECGSVSVLVSERPVSNIDPELFRSQGIEPARRKIVVVKSANAFRADYTPIACSIILVDTPGVSSPNLRTLPWTRIPRPIYPLDPM